MKCFTCLNITIEHSYEWTLYCHYILVICSVLPFSYINQKHFLTMFIKYVIHFIMFLQMYLPLQISITAQQCK